MSRLFGWSYPPGCSGPPEGPDPSELEEKIYGLLEEAKISQEYIDKICILIEDAEYDRESKLDNGLQVENEETNKYRVQPLSHIEEYEYLKYGMLHGYHNVCAAS